MFAKLQRAISLAKNPELDAVNPYYKSKYASLDSVLKVIRPALAEAGLSLAQVVETDAETATIHIHNIILSDDGQRETIAFSYPLVCNDDLHKVGAQVTYYKRISLLSLFNIVGDPDDDGNTAVPPPTKKPTPKAKPSKPQNVSRETKIKIYKAAVEAGLTKDAAKRFVVDITNGVTEQTGQTILEHIGEYAERWMAAENMREKEKIDG